MVNGTEGSYGIQIRLKSLKLNLLPKLRCISAQICLPEKKLWALHIQSHDNLRKHWLCNTESEQASNVGEPLYGLVLKFLVEFPRECLPLALIILSNLACQHTVL